MKIHAVTFDLWFTIIWSDPGLDSYYNLRRMEAILQHTRLSSPSLTIAQVEDCFRKVSERARSEGREPFEVHPNETVRRVLNELNVPVNDEAVQLAVRSYVMSGLDRIPHFNQESLEGLNQLKSMGLRLGLVSNVGRTGEAYREILRKFGVGKLFDSFSLSTEVGRGKPHREIFEHAMKALGVKAGETMHVGDSFKYDVVGAISCGMRAALYTRLWPQYQALSGLDPADFDLSPGFHIISSLRALPEVIERIH